VAESSRPEFVFSTSDLAEGVAELGLALAPAQLEQLVRYADLLARWNRVHNLTAVEPGQTLTLHLLDSLSIVPTLKARVHGTAPLRVLDVGAGGGLPGIPLAIALPAAHVTLLDKGGKKVAFLRQVQLELRLANVDAVHARVEQLRAPPFDVILARAFASLLELVRLSRPLLANDGCWCAMKGLLPRAEIEDLERAQLGVRIGQIVKLHVPRLDAERHLILIEPS
jgi:16S rRNA (guanine527-N7)-methyltransferase